MADKELEAEPIVSDPNVNDIGCVYSEMESDIKNLAGLSLHDLVATLKTLGHNPAINGDNMHSFISRAKSELKAEAKVEDELHELP